eukprot:CAMPEP_0171305040 /NCGR_PEP_ID=MMETSP0816-20121228/14812_1 /TAXON_ID=420281 /ORGANISM="Proboscia inermis, Strain CCAP1064/1" /LENGTH=117 /DNA_ID=CAMNT_0011785535 /DNA_START=80 /DNA_END=430 /DNA_ORIENTATION=+
MGLILGTVLIMSFLAKGVELDNMLGAFLAGVLLPETKAPRLDRKGIVADSGDSSQIVLFHCGLRGQFALDWGQVSTGIQHYVEDFVSQEGYSRGNENCVRIGSGDVSTAWCSAESGW